MEFQKFIQETKQRLDQFERAFTEETTQRLDQFEAVLSECKKQHDIFGGWKKIKMLVDDMTEIYELTQEERRKYFSILCQENDVCLPEKAILDTQAISYDAKTIAHNLGIYSIQGKPHTAFVTAIISCLKLSPKTSVHAKTKEKYPSTVVSAVEQWLKENRFPEKISLPWGKAGKERNFEIKYNRHR